MGDNEDDDDGDDDDGDDDGDGDNGNDDGEVCKGKNNIFCLLGGVGGEGRGGERR